MGGLAQLYDPPTPTVQWLVGKNATVYQVFKYVGKLMIVSITSVMRNLHILINCILHFRMNYIKTNANNSFQLVVDIEYLDLTVQSSVYFALYLRTMSTVIDTHTLMTAYFGYFISRIRYGLIFWWESSQIPNNLNQHN